MGADADQDTEFGLDRAVPIGRIRRLLGLFRIRIGEQRKHLRALHRLEDRLAATEHEDRPLPPADDDLLAFRNLADIEIDRAAGRKRRRIGFICATSGTNAAAAPTRPTVAVAM